MRLVTILRGLTICLLLCIAPPALSQEPTTEDPAHNELRTLRDGMKDAIQKGDIEGQLSYLHPNVVVTWQNAEVSRGRDGVRAYLDRMLKGPNKIVESYRADFDVDELTVLHGGDMGISFGSTNEHVSLAAGQSLDYRGRWSATLVKEDGKWLVANLHASTSLFENPLLGFARRMAYIAGTIAIILAIAGGYYLGRLRRAAAA